MNLSIFSGSANPPLAKAIAQDPGRALGRVVLQRFPDGELHVEIQESVRGHDVYLIQPTSPPVQRIFVTDSVARPASMPLPLQVVSLGSLLAEAITRLHNQRPLSDLLIHS
jgi:phosphoribosylpyrophosphate synthetase